MQSQVSTNAGLSPVLENGAATALYSASAVVPATADVIKAAGGAGGIQLTLTRAIYQTGNPASPTQLYAAYWAMKVDSAAGAVSFIDPLGAVFNGQPSWELVNQYQWALFVWDGTGWNVFGS